MKGRGGRGAGGLWEGGKGSGAGRAGLEEQRGAGHVVGLDMRWAPEILDFLLRSQGSEYWIFIRGMM